ncbi:peptidoglycan D,D-transpeptidase FtsI family protein [Fictibacillus aquaticus]|uniref:peptidoglycan D,D-transpeptidase FtsI family protein n=1 Tax=Fictibacillus aquaticus TaxID=2021314 RepID=UPI001F0B57F0|nr:penicillin-binding protein 2 [Fictibacillus aquaticus]
MTKVEPQKKKKTHIPFRLNVLFLVVFLLFSTLILRLGVLQIVNGEEKRLESEATVEQVAKKEAPRGIITDRNYRVVVDNDPYFSVTYTKTSDTTQEDTLKVARWLAERFEIDEKEIKRITERDKKDYFIVTNDVKKLLNKRLTPKEKKLKNDKQYKALVEKITKKDLKTLSEEDLNIIAIKRKMDQGYAYSAQPIISELKNEQISLISENLDSLPGIDIMPDSERKYPFGKSALFGEVKPIPKESMDKHLALQYDRSDRVGVSGIEKQYQEVLRGTKEMAVYLTNQKTGSTLGDPKIIEGKRGKDLTLTIDMELQFKLAKIVEEEILAAKPLPGNDMLDSAYIVMMDPRTGEIIGLAGKRYKNGKFINDEYGALFNAYAMGSSVKGATMLTGFHSKAVHINEPIYDTPKKFGAIEKSSWTNMGLINDTTALQRSSNIYMFEIMQRMIGPEHYTETYDEVRYFFSQFGLGEMTGIDFPNESTGYKGPVQKGVFGTLLDLGIGQFDTYTPIQMVQYVSTIANGGYRMKPQLVKEVREPRTAPDKEGKLLHRFEPVVLNKIDMEEKYIERVQQGFWEVMHAPRGTAKGYFDDVEKYHNPAGKTGTAQVRLKKNGGIVEKNNLTLVGYAPFDNPQIAFTVVVPHATAQNGMQRINKFIGQRALAAYWELQKKYGKDAETVNALMKQPGENEEASAQ